MSDDVEISSLSESAEEEIHSQLSPVPKHPKRAARVRPQREKSGGDGDNSSSGASSPTLSSSLGESGRLLGIAARDGRERGEEIRLYSARLRRREQAPPMRYSTWLH